MLFKIRKKSVVIASPYTIKGFQLPLVMGVALLAMYSSSLLFYSALSAQQVSSIEREADYVNLLSSFVLAEAQESLMRTLSIPGIKDNVGSLNVDTAGVKNVWNNEILNSDRNLTVVADPITGNSVNWFYQGEQWWQSNTTPSTNEASGFYTIEYSLQDVAGQDISQSDIYNGQPIRLVYTVTSFAHGPRQSKSHKQAAVAKVFYAN